MIRKLIYKRKLQKQKKKFRCCGENLNLFGTGHEFVHPENISIGKNVRINSGVIMNATESEIEIGDGVTVSSDAMIMAASYNPADFLTDGPCSNKHRYGKIKIGNNVWICAGAILLPDVTIADHVIVAAGSVVNRPITESYVAVAGNPAKIVKRYND